LTNPARGHGTLGQHWRVKRRGAALGRAQAHHDSWRLPRRRVSGSTAAKKEGRWAVGWPADRRVGPCARFRHAWRWTAQFRGPWTAARTPQGTSTGGVGSTDPSWRRC